MFRKKTRGQVIGAELQEGFTHIGVAAITRPAASRPSSRSRGWRRPAKRPAPALEAAQKAVAPKVAAAVAVAAPAVASARDTIGPRVEAARDASPRWRRPRRGTARGGRGPPRQKAAQTWRRMSRPPRRR